MADDGSPVNGPRSSGNSAMLETAFLYGGSALWIEQMQAAYAKDPSSVPESWRAFFADLGDEADPRIRAAMLDEALDELRNRTVGFVFQFHHLLRVGAFEFDVVLRDHRDFGGSRCDAGGFYCVVNGVEVVGRRKNFKNIE